VAVYQSALKLLHNSISGDALQDARRNQPSITA